MSEESHLYPASFPYSSTLMKISLPSLAALIVSPSLINVFFAVMSLFSICMSSLTVTCTLIFVGLTDLLFWETKSVNVHVSVAFPGLPVSNVGFNDVSSSILNTDSSDEVHLTLALLRFPRFDIVEWILFSMIDSPVSVISVLDTEYVGFVNALIFMVLAAFSL